MTTLINPYLNFRNHAREAIQFYQSVFGGEVKLATFEDFNASDDPKDKDLVMHSILTSPSGLVIMASDLPAGSRYEMGNNMAIALSGEDEHEVTGYWAKLAEGGTIQQPLEKAPWGDAFGMLVDSFGTQWMVNIAA